MGFRFFLLIVLLGIQFLLFRTIRRWLHAHTSAGHWTRSVTYALFGLFNAALVFALASGIRLADAPGWVRIAVVYPFYLWHGTTMILGLIILVTAIVKLPFTISLWMTERFPRGRAAVGAFRSNETVRRFDASRRAFLRKGMYGVTAASFAGNAYGMFYEKSTCDLTRADFPIRGLPPQFDGFTIGLVSDVHSSAFMTKHDMDRYVDLLLSLNATMIVIPGDFVNSMTDEVYPFAEAFSRLAAPAGVYGVMGNHDFFAAKPDVVAREIEGCGIRLLRNEHVTVTHNGARIYLMGIDDVGRPERAAERISAAARGMQDGVPRILLSHRPYFLPQAAQQDIDLVLSGHTHGGQVVFARFGNAKVTPAALASQYISGKYRLGPSQMYVSRGIGTVGLPVRLNCPPEITTITLKAS